MTPDLKEEIARLTPALVELRRDLHRHPELAFQEHRTAEIVADQLRDAGIAVTTGVGDTGVVGLLTGKAEGKTMALRADIDALPIDEESDSEYRSKTPGVMHACGHDGHTAVLLTTARVLAQHRDSLNGSVKFVFQPAEETATGAERMIAAGVMKSPTVDAMMSVHLWNYLPVGEVGLRAGPIWASADEIRITIKGRGGHGAMPHQTIDPIPVAAHVVLALENLVARETSPLDPVVFTIGSIQGGSAFNVIPSSVKMAGTLRAYDMALRDRLVERAEEIVRGVCLALRCEYDFEARFACPPVVNDPGVTELVRRTAERSQGADRVIEVAQSTAGDDVAYFFNEAPGCHIMIGSGNPARGLDRPHHHPRFDFDEGALPVAVEVLAGAVMEYLADS